MYRDLTKSVHYGYRKEYGAVLIASVYIYKKRTVSKPVRLFFNTPEELKLWVKENVKAYQSLTDVSSKDTKKLRLEGIIFKCRAK